MIHFAGFVGAEGLSAGVLRDAMRSLGRIDSFVATVKNKESYVAWAWASQ
jgi:hypothetical protein